MSTRLLTFLGTTEYREAMYRWDGQEHRTSFVAAALAKFIDTSEVVVFATQKACEKNWQGLQSAVKQAVSRTIPLRPVPLPEELEGLWEQFRVVKEELRGPPGTVTALDITHGYRSQPFFTAAVLAFVRAVDPEPVDTRVFYGAYDPLREGPTPVWELTPFVDLLDWSQALGVFLRTGHAGAVVRNAERADGRLRRSWVATKEGPAPGIRGFARALQDFAADLATVRTGKMVLVRARSSAARLCASLEAVREEIQRDLPPLADVLDRIKDLATGLVAEDFGSVVGRAALANLARTYLHFERYPEALVTVREYHVSRYAKSGAVNPGRGWSRDVRQAAEQELQRRGGSVAKQIAQIRNDVMHGGYGPNPLPADALVSMTSRLVEKMPEVTEGVSALPAGGPRLFLNLSNHPSAEWSREQGDAALEWADEIVDLPFPSVDPQACAADIGRIAAEVASRVPPGVTHAMVMGEATLTFALVRRLSAAGVTCLASTTARRVEQDAAGRKISEFGFVGFREYLA